MKKSKSLTKSDLKTLVSKLTPKQCESVRSLIDDAHCEQLPEKMYECDVVVTKYLILDVLAATEDEAREIVESADFLTDCDESFDSIDQGMDEIDVTDVNLCE